MASKLFSPFKLRDLEIPNRIMVSPRFLPGGRMSKISLIAEDRHLLAGDGLPGPVGRFSPLCTTSADRAPRYRPDYLIFRILKARLSAAATAAYNSTSIGVFS